jgi:hypothetical protein
MILLVISIVRVGLGIELTKVYVEQNPLKSR